MSGRDQAHDDGLPWGFMDGDTFIAVPKSPLLSAGYGPPPFDIEMPDGQMRHITHLVEYPITADQVDAPAPAPAKVATRAPPHTHGEPP